MTHIGDWLRGLIKKPDIAIFYNFRPPPYGGANQFLLALREELRRRRFCVEANIITSHTFACLINSHTFDLAKLRRMYRATCRVVQRVDGPIGTYRGTDYQIDRQIAEINSEVADATIFQSKYSLESHRQLGIEFRNPVVIMNAADARYFYSKNEKKSITNRKVRLISTSWSDNPNKGAPIYKWLEKNLNWDRFEYTFVGRTKTSFEKIHVLPPVESAQLGNILRNHDIYLTASLHESCSNALLEALACGLPAIYANSGGNPEIAGEGGLAFSDKEEVPYLLDQLIDEFMMRRAKIRAFSIAETTDKYLSVMTPESVMFHACP